MKTLAVEKTDLSACIERAREERVIVTHDGAPVALVVGIDGLDQEQIELGSSTAFWKLIRRRRREKAISRTALEEKLGRRSSISSRAPKRVR